MKIRISWCLLVLIINLSSALEVRLAEAYYEVAPTSMDNLQDELLNSTTISGGQAQHKIVGEYSASVQIKRMELQYRNGQCRVKCFELTLEGVMTLPKLKLGQYPLKLRLAFEAEVLSLKQHELKHEVIWKTFLKEYEKTMKKLTVADDESCRLLTDTINNDMDAILKEIDRRNKIFDCVSYGRRIGLIECNDY